MVGFGSPLECELVAKMDPLDHAIVVADQGEQVDGEGVGGAFGIYGIK